jgi:hypothetical protein
MKELEQTEKKLREQEEKIKQQQEKNRDKIDAIKKKQKTEPINARYAAIKNVSQLFNKKGKIKDINKFKENQRNIAEADIEIYEKTLAKKQKDRERNKDLLFNYKSQPISQSVNKSLLQIKQDGIKK